MNLVQRSTHVAIEANLALSEMIALNLRGDGQLKERVLFRSHLSLCQMDACRRFSPTSEW
jgi:hypothetical protein